MNSVAMNTEQLIALLPFMVLAATAIVVMLFIAWRRHHWWTGTLTVIGLNAALVAVIYVSQILPAEITTAGIQLGGIGVTPLLMLDGFSCFYMGLLLITTLACSTLMNAYMDGFQDNREEIYLLLLIAALGAMVLVSSRHLAGLFIGLELLSVPVYGMVAYTFRNKRALEAGIKYIVLSATASAMLLFGMALIYAVSGTLSFSGLGFSYTADAYNPLLLAGTALMIAGLAFKLSIAPFHLWTPDVYEGAPAPVAAFLATASKTAVFAALIRFFYESGALHADVLRDVLAILAGISIVVGNLLAVQQTSIKRLLAYSSIAHFGYLLVPVVGGVAVEAVTVYLVTYVVTSLGAFGVVTLMSSPFKGQDADQLFNYRGLFWRRPYLTAVMTVMMLSLAGIPFTAGFIGKFYIAAIGVDAQLWWLLGALVVGSAIGLFYYLRVVVALFMPTPGMRRMEADSFWGVRVGGIMVIAMAALMFVLGVYPEPAIELVQLASVAVFR